MIPFPIFQIYKLLYPRTLPTDSQISTSRFRKITHSLLKIPTWKKERKKMKSLKSRFHLVDIVSRRGNIASLRSRPLCETLQYVDPNGNTERKRVAIAEATGTMSNQWSCGAKYRFTKRPFDQGPQHTSTHGRAKSGWRIQWWPRHRRLSVSSFHERV